MMYENSLGSFSFDVIERILDLLSQQGISMKKTNLASKAGLNYNVCLRYILMLGSLGWIEVNSEVRITDIGKGVFANLIDVSEVIAGAGANVWVGNQRETSTPYLKSSHAVTINTAESIIIIISDPEANSFSEQAKDRK